MNPTPSSELRYLNLGCGRRFHPAWRNVDFVASSPSVQAHNLRDGIPYPDASFEVVYHSHLLEHFPRELAPEFLEECYRVLKPGGILRVVVPDLENIVRNYLETLERAKLGLPGWDANYDWMLLELYDQTVREQTGGGWNAFLRQDPIPNWEFVHARAGAEAQGMLAEIQAQAAASLPESQSFVSKLGFVLKNFPRVFKNKLTRGLLSKSDYEALQLGRFRRGGEIHQWMYDCYSLARLLRNSGFLEPHKVAATESAIPDWASYCLDNEPDGSTYKPDSLYMEAKKPVLNDALR
jgi:SAM-dependent methyltransferase